MTREEWIVTLRNVASDLEAIASQMDLEGEDQLDELVADAKLVAEYIQHEDPHL